MINKRSWSTTSGGTTIIEARGYNLFFGGRIIFNPTF